MVSDLVLRLPNLGMHGKKVRGRKNSSQLGLKRKLQERMVCNIQWKWGRRRLKSSGLVGPTMFKICDHQNINLRAPDGNDEEHKNDHRKI